MTLRRQLSAWVAAPFVSFSSFTLALSFTLMALPLPAQAISSEAYTHYQQGVKLERLNHFRAAEQEYRMAIALDPYDSLTYIRLAYLAERDDRKDEALQYYQQALQLNPKDSMIHLAIARLWENKNQPSKAIEEYKRLLADMPDYTYAYLPLARLEKSTKQTAEATQDYQQFLKAYPKHYDAQRELASLQLHQQNYTQAATSYKALQTAHPDKFKDNLAYGTALNNTNHAQDALKTLDNVPTPSADLYEQKAKAYQKLNRLPEAYQAYATAIQMAPQDKNDLNLQAADVAMSLNQPQNAINNLKAYLAQDPKNVHVLKSLADLEVQQKDYAAATPLYEDSLKQTPEADKDFQAEILRGQGYALQMQNKPAEATAAYEKSLALKDDDQARLNLALLYHQQKQYGKAVDLYRQLLANNPKSPTLRHDMGQALLAQGDQAYQAKDYKNALAAYQDALLTGDAPEETVLLGIANTEYAQKNLPLAYTGYQRILEKDPNNNVALLNKAQIDLSHKNYVDALQGLRKVVDKHPDSLEAYRLLAETHEGLGDYGQASVYYQKALELQPTDSTLLIRSGNVWRMMGNLDKAQQAYETARNTAPNDAVLHYNLGSVYNMKNKLDASLNEYKTALQLNPSMVESYYGMGNTLEKQKKPAEALDEYQQYLKKASSSASYVALAKSRIRELSKVVKTKPADKSAATIKAKPDAKVVSVPKSTVTKTSEAKPSSKPAVKTIIPVSNKPASVKPIPSSKAVVKKALSQPAPPPAAAVPTGEE